MGNIDAAPDLTASKEEPLCSSNRRRTASTVKFSSGCSESWSPESLLSPPFADGGFRDVTKSFSSLTTLANEDAVVLAALETCCCVPACIIPPLSNMGFASSSSRSSSDSTFRNRSNRACPSACASGCSIIVSKPKRQKLRIHERRVREIRPTSAVDLTYRQTGQITNITA